MERITVTDKNGNFAGWFDKDKATDIAWYKEGEPYTTGKTLFATKMGKLVIHPWTNYNTNNLYRFAENEEEIAEILAKGLNIEEKDLSERLKEILTKYEI